MLRPATCIANAILLLIAAGQLAADHPRFEKLVLSEAFHSEGAAVADFNGDGHQDIVSGPYWYQGPNFNTRHRYADVKRYAIAGYSDHFFSFADDFNGDGAIDILSIPIPGNPGVWYENPGQNTAQTWKQHPVLSSVDNESPTFEDITGDGRRELVCIHQGQYGYATPDPDAPEEPWAFVAVSEHRGYGRFTHGLGVGDVDRDGKADLLEKDGWWQQGSSPDQRFRFHPTKLAQSGGSQMFAYDFDGDGDQDIVSVQNAHGYGLTFFERRDRSDEFFFVPHEILKSDSTPNHLGLSISQMHALALADLDGDGIKDIITGKRFWAHGGKDPAATELPVLYWFRTRRTTSGVHFEPHLIDTRVGVGTQLTTADVDNNGRVDIVVGNKLGTFVLFNHATDELAESERAESEHAESGLAESGLAESKSNRLHPSVSGDEFKTAIRTSEPQSPQQERMSFTLPPGFEVQLVAAEPEIAKPMNMAFDTRGRLWVSSSVEYPFPAEQGKGRDTIKILEDTNGDGKANKITTFADGLNIPIGLYPYRDGVVCYSIPNIWWLRDTDGDDVCDQRQVLYGPFDYSRDTHGMCNGFTRGFDGWMYACHGFNNRSNVAGTDGHRVTMNSGNTFRIRLDGTRIEHFTDGQVNPFGMAINPGGDLFTADCHTKPITLLLRGGVYEGFGKPHDGLGFVPSVMNHLHGSTAIGGIAIYHDQEFPTEYHGNTFHGNVMTSRVNRNSLQQSGATIRAREEADFMISADPWFRPVDLQLGPDGALYIADFYNRIIGHYEVGLDHPGRDRYRGRIWRVVYRPNGQRRDFMADGTLHRSDQDSAHVDSDLGRIQSVESLIKQLSSANLTTRMLATDRLVDEFADESVSALKSHLAQTNSNHSYVHTAWALYRLGMLSDSMIIDAANHDQSLIRLHALRIIEDHPNQSDSFQQCLVRGLADPDADVRRAAAMASSRYRSPLMTTALLESLKKTPPGDQHFRHTVRMSLRNQLRDQGHFEQTVKTLDPSDLKVVVDLCLGIRTEFAGRFLASQLTKLKDIDRNRLTEFLSFAARYASIEDLDEITAMVEQNFSQDIAFQEQLIRSVRSGLLQRGSRLPPVVNQWAIRLACRYLEIESPDGPAPTRPQPLQWTSMDFPGVPGGENPWTISTKRNSADGEQGSQLHSSFPKGEKLTGVYRSGSFELPKQFEFYLAGHDGYPDKPLGQRNLVRVRDSGTNQVLNQWSPPRNDTAQKYSWQTGDDQGRSVVVELVDGDAASAFAWIAVGRFSVAGLNPSRLVEKYSRAAGLIGDFQLREFETLIRQILQQDNLNLTVAQSFALAIASIHPSASRKAMADAVAISGISPALRESLFQGLFNRKPTAAETNVALLKDVAKAATAAQQLQLANHLAADKDGCETLLLLVESGSASARLLVAPSVQDRFMGIAAPSQAQRREHLIEDLPDEDTALIEVMEKRKAAFLSSPGSVQRGKDLFAKQCAVCHQVAEKGTAVGPNLDGIGNRGLDRLLEDVLMPNRNVDAAFRASLLLTDDGNVTSGLVKREEGARIVLVDQAGKEISVLVDQVVRRKGLRTSPMPANFHETLNESQTGDLFAYLLSLTR